MISKKVSRKIEFGLWCGEHRLQINTKDLGKIARFSPWQVAEDGERAYFYYQDPISEPEPVIEAEEVTEVVEEEPIEPEFLFLENLILGLHPSANVVHINGDCLDFRRANLQQIA
jgi:hypothetical protein